jgi:hypothetical protein
MDAASSAAPTSRETMQNRHKSWNTSAPKPAHRDLSAPEFRNVHSLGDDKTSRHDSKRVQAPHLNGTVSNPNIPHIPRDSVPQRKNDSDERGRKLHRSEQTADSNPGGHDGSHVKKSKTRNQDPSNYSIAQSQPIVQPSEHGKTKKSVPSRSSSRTHSTNKPANDHSKSSHRSSTRDDAKTRKERDRSHVSAKEDLSRSSSRTSTKKSPDLLAIPGNGPHGTHHSRSASPGTRLHTQEHKTLKHTKSESRIDTSTKHRGNERSAKDKLQRGSLEKDSSWYTGDTLQVPGEGYRTDSSGYSSSYYSSSRESLLDSPGSAEIQLPSSDEDEPSSRSTHEHSSHQRTDASKAKKIGLNDIRPDYDTAERMGNALKELLFCREMFKKWTEQLDECV